MDKRTQNREKQVRNLTILVSVYVVYYCILQWILWWVLWCSATMRYKGSHTYTHCSLMVCVFVYIFNYITVYCVELTLVFVCWEYGYWCPQVENNFHFIARENPFSCLCVDISAVGTHIQTRRHTDTEIHQTWIHAAGFIYTAIDVCKHNVSLCGLWPMPSPACGLCQSSLAGSTEGKLWKICLERKTCSEPMRCDAP